MTTEEKKAKLQTKGEKECILKGYYKITKNK